MIVQNLLILYIVFMFYNVTLLLINQLGKQLIRNYCYVSEIRQFDV